MERKEWRVFSGRDEVVGGANVAEEVGGEGWDGVHGCGLWSDVWWLDEMNVERDEG